MCDIRLASQLAYHFCRLDCEDKEVVAAQNALITLANKFHRVEECGVLKPQTNAGELKTNKTDGRKGNKVTIENWIRRVTIRVAKFESAGSA